MSALQNPANRASDSRVRLSVVVIGSVSLATALVHVVFCALCVRFAGAPGEPSPQLLQHDAHAGAHDSSSRTQSLIESVDRDVMHARNDTLFSWRATRKRWPPAPALRHANRQAAQQLRSVHGQVYTCGVLKRCTKVVRRRAARCPRLHTRSHPCVAVPGGVGWPQPGRLGVAGPATGVTDSEGHHDSRASEGTFPIGRWESRREGP